MKDPASLVAAMFVFVLSIGLAQVLLALADIAGGLRKPRPALIHLSWLVQQLFVHLWLFWTSTVIFDLQSWSFPQSLIVLSGPMLMLFAAGVIASPQDEASERDATGHFLSLAPRYFVIHALAQAWLALLDYLYAGVGAGTAVSMTLCVFFAGLAMVRNIKVHQAAAAVLWAASVGDLIFGPV